MKNKVEVGDKVHGLEDEVGRSPCKLTGTVSKVRTTEPLENSGPSVSFEKEISICPSSWEPGQLKKPTQESLERVSAFCERDSGNGEGGKNRGKKG